MSNNIKTAISSGSDKGTDNFVPTPPTRENPTPDWRTHRRLPDDRPHPAMVPSHERYVEASPTGLLTSCSCGVIHSATVYADGSYHCEESGKYFVATAATPELLAMRKQFERETIERIRACELH
jgi:hypothetical protein